MENVLDHLARAGAIQERGGRWTVTEEAAAASELAEGLRPFLQRRLAGEVLLAEGENAASEASSLRALEVALGQGARSLELHAAASLSRLGSQAQLASGDGSNARERPTAENRTAEGRNGTAPGLPQRGTPVQTLQA